MIQPTPAPTGAGGEGPSRRDQHLMGIAIAMAWRGVGTTAPNPSVGAVVADAATGEIIARATTASGGRPHAEPIALAAAGPRAAGATLYVTLEPCSHHGRTPPCADAVVASRIARVVVGIEDPDPRVAGRGLDRLRQAGIVVTRGVRAAEAHRATIGHVTRVTQRRPFVQLKLAVGADGAVPQGRDGQPLFVTSPEARAHGHLLRARSDAIMIGRGTLQVDDPELTCRLPGLLHRSPIRIVLARHGLDLAGSRLAATAGVAPVIVVHGPIDGQGAGPAAGASAAIATLDGLRTIEAPVVAGALWLPAVLEALAEQGVTRLLVEGGPALWRSFAQAGLVDEVVLYIAGESAGRAADPLAVARAHLGALPLQVADTRVLGPDRMFRLAVAAPGQSPSASWSPLIGPGTAAGAPKGRDVGGGRSE